MNKVTQRSLLSRIETFYDSVPRRDAAVEQYGSVTLFVRAGAGWPLYARPTLGAPPPDVNTIQRVRERQRELGLPEAFEWVDDVSPGLAGVAAAAGLSVLRCPLMVLETPVQRASGPSVTFLSPDDDGALASAILAVGAAAFGAPPPAFSRPSAADVLALSSGAVARAAIADETGAVVCSGSYQRAGDVVEIVGVGTLPSARRRGLGAAVTAALAAHALDRGASVVFLSAGSADVARLYGRLGFTELATACIAEPA